MEEVPKRTRDLTVYVVGRPAAGKSTIGAVIAKALKEAGFTNVTLNDQELVHPLEGERLEKRTEVMKTEAKIVIEMGMQRRGSRSFGVFLPDGHDVTEFTAVNLRSITENQNATE
jgi:adenylylsulfate kinase-like enzyme